MSHEIEEPHSSDPLNDGHVMSMNPLGSKQFEPPPFKIGEPVNKPDTQPISDPNKTIPVFTNKALNKEALRSNLQSGSTTDIFFKFIDEVQGVEGTTGLYRAVNRIRRSLKKKRGGNTSVGKTSQSE